MKNILSHIFEHNHENTHRLNRIHLLNNQNIQTNKKITFKKSFMYFFFEIHHPFHYDLIEI